MDNKANVAISIEALKPGRIPFVQGAAQLSEAPNATVEHGRNGRQPLKQAREA